MNALTDPAFQYSICLSYAMLFGWAGVHKLQSRAQFQQVLKSYRVLPSQLNSLVAISIPVVELAIAAALAIPEWRKMAAIGASLLLACYALAMASTIIRKLDDVDCGCSFGSDKQLISRGLVVRNLVLSVFPLVLLLEHNLRELYWLDWLLTIFSMTAFSLIYLIVNTLLEQQRKLKGLLP